MILVALDTSCLNAKQTNLVLNALDELEKAGTVKTVTSTVNSREQVATNLREEYREKYLKRIAEKGPKPEVGYWGESSWGGCVYGDKTVADDLVEIFGGQAALSRSNFFDIWLLQTAIAHRCQYFLTTNKRDFIEGGRKERIEALGIKVREPNDNFLVELQGFLI